MNSLPARIRRDITAARVANARLRVAEARVRALDAVASGRSWWPRPSAAAPSRRVSIALWLPLTPLFLLLAPLAVLAAPMLMLGSLYRSRRWRGFRSLGAIWALGAVLLSLSGTFISVDTPAARIRLRIF